MKASSMVLACLMLTVSCSKELDKRTKSLEEKTTQMSESTTKMEEKVDILVDSNRSKNAANLRLTTFTHLLDEKTDFDNKVADAEIFFKSFEYQELTFDEISTDRQLKDRLYEDAVNEFTNRISGIHKKINFKKLNPTSDRLNNEEQAFYALAVTLHSKLQAKSMNDFIESAFIKSATYDYLETHENILLEGKNKTIIIDLLKARVDILSAMALDNITNRDKMGIIQKGKQFIFKLTRGYLGNIDLPETYELTNSSTKDLTVKYLNMALKTKKVLKDAGQEQKLDKNLASAFEHLNFNTSSKDEEKILVDTKKETIKSLIRELVE